MVNVFKAGKGQKRESSAYKHEKSKSHGNEGFQLRGFNGETRHEPKPSQEGLLNEARHEKTET